MDQKISIIMGIYNCEDTLSEAIESIFQQTYKNWELIMCDDGSSDSTYVIAQNYQRNNPERIVLIKNQSNIGLNRTLNHCLEYVSGTYVARMDADDLSLPTRLEKEICFLKNNPEISIVSCPMIYFDECGDFATGNVIENPTKKDFVLGTPFCHAPCMVKTEVYKAVGGYSTDKRTMRAEDYDLWFRMYAKGYKGHNLQEPLYKMRDDEKAYKRRKFKYCINEAYVRFNGYRLLRLPLKSYIWVLRPIIVGIMPKSIYMMFHRRRKSK